MKELLENVRRLLPISFSPRLLTGAVTFLADVLFTRMLNIASPRGPLFVTWLITMDCNAACKFCNTHQMKGRFPEDINLNEALSLADQIANAGTLSVSFTGGEVLLSPFLFPVAQRLRRRGVPFYFVTNGLLLEEQAKAIVESGAEYIIVSLDSDDPNEHDRMRNSKGLFDKAVRGIERVKMLRNGKRPLIKTTTVVSHRNLDRLDQILDFMNTIADIASIQPISYGGRNSPHGKAKNDLNDYVFNDVDRLNTEHTIRELIRKRPSLNSQYFRMIPTWWFEPAHLASRFPCWSPFLRMLIMPNGDVLQCAMSDQFPVIGNLKHMSLMDAWNSNEMKRQREIIRFRRNECICWTQDTSINAFLGSVPLMNRLPNLGKRVR